MKSKDRPRFDVQTLRACGGETVFGRGEAYYRNRQVEILAAGPARVLAQVEGTEDYRTVVTGRGTEIGGECSCPAFEDWGFCKHMVATALTANEAGEAAGGDTFARIRKHLTTKGLDAVVEMIVALSDRDPALLRKLDAAAALVDADDKTLETRLRKAIDSATRTGGYVDYHEAPDWADGVEQTLDTIGDLVEAGRAALAMDLVRRAVTRIGQAIESIDDSDGCCGELLHRARDIHLAACGAAVPDPVKLARDLYALEMEDDTDTFHGAATLYAEVLGEPGLAEYRRLATEAWDELPPRTGPQEHSIDYAPLADILDFFAERDGDVEARIAIRTKNLSSPWCYLRLAEFCQSVEREDEALRRAEEGLWVFEDERPDERLVFLAVELLSKAGRMSDAEAHLWRAFEAVPSLELYKRIRPLGGTAARDRALSLLETRLAEVGSTPWCPHADLFIGVLMEETMLDEAWAAARRHKASRGMIDTLAAVSEASHPDAAIEVYAQRVEDFVNAGGNPGYEKAAGLIARMAALRGAEEQAAYVADLKERFRRKRNFMRLLG